MRYDVRFCNGTWQVFDTQEWTAVGAFILFRLASDRALQLNG